MYQVLARKWRPKNFDELIGQEHIARTLRNSIEANRLAHAYIFAGLRGTGKTTVARILAKCLNCESGPTATPCGTCASCREITDGRSMDVLEMDAASRTGVDDIRELQEVVAYAPVRDHRKILIINEAHMLSRNAANALLKTLEEPPPRVVFILATTEVQKLLPTILSRCQIHEFRRVPPREVAAHLAKVCAAESLQASDAILDRIARAGEGSVRDALTLLERVVAFAGNTVAEDDALYVLGAVRSERLVELVAALARRDAPRMLAVLDALIGEGHDLLHVWSELLGALRDLLLVRVLPGRADLLARPPEEAERLQTATASLTREDFSRAFQILADLEYGLKGSAQPRFLFEAALIRLADLGSVRPIEQVLSLLASEGHSQQGQSPAAADAQKKNHPVIERVDPDRTPSRTAPAPERTSDPTTPLQRLAAFRARLHDVRPMTDVLLDTAALSWDGDQVDVIFSGESDAVGRQMARKESIALLESVASQVAGKRITVRVHTGPGGKGDPAFAGKTESTAPSPDADTPSQFAIDPPDAQLDRLAVDSERERLLDDATKDPGIACLLREFGAHVVEIRPLLAPQVNHPADESEDAG